MKIDGNLTRKDENSVQQNNVAQSEKKHSTLLLVTF